MRLKKNYITISLILVFVLTFSFVCIKLFGDDQESATRTINVNEIGTLSYEEVAEALLEDFDVYSVKYDNNNICFEGSITKLNSDFKSLQFLSVGINQEITTSYSTRMDTANETFILETIVKCGDQIIEKTEMTTEPFFDAEKNDYFIKLADGSLISVSEQFNNSNMNSCIALVDDAAILLVAALAITVVAAAPTITTVVKTVVTTVVSWFKSFFWWLRRLFTRTVTTTTTTTVASPSFTINNTTYKTKEVSKTDVQTKSKTDYFAALADPTNGKMYMSIVPLDTTVAIAILNTPIAIPCIADTNRTMVLSTYTFWESNAVYIASIVGLSPRTPAGLPEKHGANYYYHYHTHSEITTIGKNGETVLSSPHSFFGLPA